MTSVIEVSPLPGRPSSGGFAPPLPAGRPAVARRRFTVEGIVQGVGFRPYVYRLAVGLGLRGFVRNDTGAVVIEVEGGLYALDSFAELLAPGSPPLAAIHRISSSSVPPAGDASFVIADSTTYRGGSALVSADVATCPACLRELADPTDRRFEYPFINCTNCGPRYTITTRVPYDRPYTTMAGFVMCSQCGGEYADPSDRRFHAQPIACPTCGPTLTRSIRSAARLLRDGKIVAVKALGGYQLACDATNPAAVSRLRTRKRREEKPFAVMVANLTAAGQLCALTPEESQLLASPCAPIVLCSRQSDAPIAAEVAPGNRWLGLMLPTTPLHHLMLAATDRPLVMTSGNMSESPIVCSDTEAQVVLGSVADAFLSHNRSIAARADDSVARVSLSGPLLLRRARGYAPEPVALPRPLLRPVLGVGGQLKSTFCLAAGSRAFLSPHIGDLGTLETMRAFTETLAHYRTLFAIEPEILAHDLHPDYLSTKWALDQDRWETVGVQHHHAHIATCLAENGQTGPVIGLALDGTGYGTDGTLWGGEILVSDLATYERAGHLAAVPLPGGEAAVREPWRMAAGYLLTAFGPDTPAGLALATRHRDKWAAVMSLARSGTASPRSSGAGRLFDAVAAVITGRDRVSYEGQAAAELEQVADPHETRLLPCPVRNEADGVIIDTPTLFRSVVDRHLAGAAPEELAARFHNALAAALVEAASIVSDKFGLRTVALSGGCFQNALLTDRCTTGLAGADFAVLAHHQVPPNDGGISLGQAVVAGARSAQGIGSC